MEDIVRKALIAFRKQRASDGTRYLVRANLPEASKSQAEISLRLAVDAFEDYFDADDALSNELSPLTGLTRQKIADAKKTLS